MPQKASIPATLLQRPHPRVDALQRQQLRMVAALNNLTGIHDQNLMRIDNCG